jgi:hypothetical protein
MWYTAEIALKSYLPLELEEGMLFVNRISVGVVEPYVELWELEEIPEDIDEFMSKNGAPVEVLIIIDSYTKYHPEVVVINQDQIGWWDDGPDTDELRDISLDDINYTLREEQGFLSIDIDDEEEGLEPTLVEDKVILSFLQEDDDDIEDWDVTLNDGLEEI